MRILAAVQNLGGDLIPQRRAAHIGIYGNESADKFVKAAHAADTPTTTSVGLCDVARKRVSLAVTSCHPVERIAAGTPPRPLPRNGLTRRERAFGGENASAHGKEKLVLLALATARDIREHSAAVQCLH